MKESGRLTVTRRRAADMGGSEQTRSSMSSTQRRVELSAFTGIGPTPPVIKAPTCPSRSEASHTQSIPWGYDLSIDFAPSLIRLELCAERERFPPIRRLAS